MLDFVFRDRLLSKVIDIFIERLHRFDRALALGPHGELLNAGMPEIGSDAAAYVVSQAAFGANVVEKAGGESAGEGLIENRNGVIVGIATRCAQRDHVNGALVHVVFRDEVITRLGRVIRISFFGISGPLGQESNAARSLASTAFGIEVSADAQDDVIGVNVGRGASRASPGG